MSERWTIKDEDGNVLNTFTGLAKERYVGTDWNGVTVASVEQLPATPARQTETERLQAQIDALTLRVEALEDR